jgi:hypothetical protein
VHDQARPVGIPTKDLTRAVGAVALAAVAIIHLVDLPDTMSETPLLGYGYYVLVADLMAAAREQGIRRLSDVEVAVLEADGSISFFKPESGSAASFVDDASGAADKPRAVS